MNKNANRVLALRENYFASVDEIQKCIAEDWGVCVNPESGIAVVSVLGATRASYWGAGTYTRLRAQIETLLDNDNVRCIVLEVNSPGGDVNGLFECCEYIAKAKETKPIHAHVTGMCCSAAYAIAASCTDISATQTSEIGSVGVYAQAYDDSEFLKKEGILSRIFRSKNAEKKNASPFSEDTSFSRAFSTASCMLWHICSASSERSALMMVFSSLVMGLPIISSTLPLMRDAYLSGICMMTAVTGGKTSERLCSTSLLGISSLRSF